MDATDLTTLTQAAEGLQAMPWGAHALAALAIVAGFVMWCAGRRFVRPLYALSFAVIGGALGFTGPATIGLEVDPSISLLVGAALGAILGIVLYRFTMASTLSAVGALAAPLIAVAAINFTGNPIVTTDTLAQADLLLQDTLDSTGRSDAVFGTNPTLGLDSGEAADAMLGEIGAAALSASQQVRELVLNLLGDVRQWFDTMPTDQQLLLVMVSIVGAAIGFTMGFAFPGRVSAVGTAFVGAAIWLPALVWLIRLIGVEVSTTSQWSPLSWLVIWATVSVAGVLLQWTSPKPRADD